MLLWVVGRIRENPRVKQSHYPISAQYLDAILVGMDELVVEENIPLRMKVLSFAVTHEDIRRLATDPFGSVVFEIWGKLYKRHCEKRRYNGSYNFTCSKKATGAIKPLEGFVRRYLESFPKAR